MSGGRFRRGRPGVGKTRVEGGTGPPPTRLESGAATRVEGSAVIATRVNLPLALAARFEALADIGRRGAEADLLVVTDRESGDRRVVKLYRQAARGLDEEMLERVRRARPAHVVKVIESDVDDGLVWELLEYCELGSLEDLLELEAEELERPGAREALASQVLGEVAAALEHIHDLGFAHRDVKPPNVLVRTRQPFDLVLADFGLATVLRATQHFGTSSRTVAYAAPEASWGKHGPPSDWWSLGITLAEILAGRHPFAQAGGELAPEVQINEELATRPVDLSGVEDERFRLLCRGLLTRDPEHRWGAAEVAVWRDGGSPPVWRDDGGSVAARRRRVAPFPFRDPKTGQEREFTDPVALANALASDWEAAVELVEGRDRRQRKMLRDFLDSVGFENAERLLADDDPPEAILVRMLVGLDPDIEPTFRGLSLSREGLRRLVVEALTKDARADTLEAIYDGRVLRHYATEDGERADYSSLDSAWHRNSRDLEAHLERLRPVLPENATAKLIPVARARILFAQLDPEARRALEREAEEARRDMEALEQPWFKEIIKVRGHEGTATQLTAILARDEAARRSRVEAEEQRRVQAEERNREREAARARQRQQMAQASRASRVGVRSTLWSLVVLLAALVAGYAVWTPGRLGVGVDLFYGLRTVILPLGAAGLAAVAIGALYNTLIVENPRPRFWGSSRRLIPLTLAAGSAIALAIASGQVEALEGIDRWGGTHLPPSAWLPAALGPLAGQLALVAGLAMGRSRALASSAVVGAVAALAIPLVVLRAALPTADSKHQQEAEVLRQAIVPSTGRCRARLPDRPGGPRYLVRAELVCVDGSVKTRWIRYRGNLAAGEAFSRRENAVSVSEQGECRRGGNNVGGGTWHNSSNPDDSLGKFMCFHDRKGAHIVWTDETSSTLVSALRRDGHTRQERKALYGWWRGSPTPLYLND